MQANWNRVHKIIVVYTFFTLWSYLNCYCMQLMYGVLMSKYPFKSDIYTCMCIECSFISNTHKALQKLCVSCDSLNVCLCVCLYVIDVSQTTKWNRNSLFTVEGIIRIETVFNRMCNQSQLEIRIIHLWMLTVLIINIDKTTVHSLFCCCLKCIRLLQYEMTVAYIHTHTTAGCSNVFIKSLKFNNNNYQQLQAYCKC